MTSDENEDAAFPQLRLWRDANHNGVSEAQELYTLPELAVERISLKYKESKRVDGHGNAFRYRAKIGDTAHFPVGTLGLGCVPRRRALTIVLGHSDKRKTPSPVLRGFRICC